MANYTKTSKLEGIAQQAWAERDLKKAKRLIIDYIEGTRIKSKNQIVDNVTSIKNKTRLDFYIANSLLQFEGLGTKLY